ncbi:hypothetical protein OG500_31980 [Kitasatospora sp. NBC_01250]|uniref:hypothetical protein n=1 Tax=unclassified Kitasatospora TaxID=2633591 RepID=UPI002E14D7E3|nr:MULTISPECIES: hypothetical protein [unclassified Kitasatospora]WSJ70612.1 hypothetical protein OG294_33505 [Kitasatospora sp. NBC_01302]
MGAELVELAMSGAAVFVSAAATDLWGEVKERAGRLLTHGRADRAEAARLEVAYAELALAEETGDGAVVQRIQQDWESRLRELLASDPAAAAELRSLLDILDPGNAAQPSVVVHNHNEGTVHGTVLQIGTVGKLTYGTQ